MRKHLPRKPDEDGIEIKTLNDIGGYLFNGVICCDEPLRYDEHVGRTTAVVYELLQPYLRENRVVGLFSMFMHNYCTLSCTYTR